MRIGLTQRTRLDDLRQILSDLAEVSTGEFVSAFEKQLQDVNNWQARVAAIGQVKAGKSSTLNALIGEIGFLPSDVNPWTSVVTSMRINVPGDPEWGARFDFFDEESWDKVINGDPRIRDAARENLPGFDAEVLREQTEDMRRNAERRLGKYYHSLLGSKHEYDMLSSDLLQRYVCAGPGADAGLERESLGRYSAITRAANLFMRSENYAVPTIITDTPGVNDPFLVRDEFTCQSLDESDIFLMTLSAHQALTEVDIALIRMVAMQGDKDVIIYVNRIDELENYPSRLNRVVGSITGRLNDAIPEGNFSIIYGSARWAELAISKEVSEADIAEVVDDPLFDEFLRVHRNKTSDDVREKLSIASGLNEVKASISHAIASGSGSRFIDRTKTEASVQLAAFKSVMERQRHQLMDQIESYGSGRVAEFKESIEDELHQLEEVDSSIEHLLLNIDNDLDQIVNDTWVSIQQEMDRETGKFIGDRSADIEAQLNSKAAAGEEMEIELLPLRVAMEGCVSAGYQQAREKIDAILQDTLDQAIQNAETVTAGLDSRISLDMLPGETVAVTFATSRKMVSLNFASKRGWNFWKKNKAVDATKTIEALKKVTLAEVHPAKMKMIDAFTETMTGRILAGKDRLGLVRQIVEQSLTDRRERLEADQAILSGSSDDIAEKTINRLQSDIEVIDNRLQAIAAKESLLSADAMQTAA